MSTKVFPALSEDKCGVSYAYASAGVPPSKEPSAGVHVGPRPCQLFSSHLLAVAPVRDGHWELGQRVQRRPGGHISEGPPHHRPQEGQSRKYSEDSESSTIKLD